MKRSIVPFLTILFASILFAFIGCKDSSVAPPDEDPDKAALQEIADEDSAMASFDPNYNEEDQLSLLGKTGTQIYPFRKIWHRVSSVSRTFNVTITGDSALGVYSKNYEGILYIAASYDSDAVTPDTVIQKPFASTVTRNIIFVKIGNTDRPKLNWRVAAISLPEGGTQSPHIDLTKLTIFLPSADTMVITSPNDYYLSRWHRWWRSLPIISRGETVTLQVELYSEYQGDDFVTLTYGANILGLHMAKKKFDLVSSTPSGTGYVKVYQQTYSTNQWPGFYHAVINAFPNQVITDDAAPVENEMWGIPYFVKF
ncbi:MAG TPA: hypothetical protein VMT35_07365 [Ignavibacteriaceae bacterium]|nr:hypothetical protein [Ignavibacteriaceae bacterium]